ncbi:MAG: hypothetical protein GY787_34265, partial [Alteromonadales bacterium]|nr:hypothetical protein [Alteromonadales bacterium]
VTDTPDQEVWTGTIMLDLPRSGPAHGYWMTIHRDVDPQNSGPFAIGIINIVR